MKVLTGQFRQPWGVAGIVFTLLIGIAGAALAQPVRPHPVAPGATGDPEPSDPMAPEMDGVTIVEHLGDHVPLDLPFVDQDGQPVTLGDYFEGGRPVVLMMNYYRCPMLCTLVMNGALNAMKQVDLDLGRDYRVITVSVDPAETASLARIKHDAYAAEAAEPVTEANRRARASRLTSAQFRDGWDFLTGEQHNIVALADAVGFGYKWVESQKQYAHPAALILLGPDGKITRYLYGIEFAPDTLRLSLVETSQGKIGTALDRFLLTCFHFDPNAGDYSWHAMAIMQAGGALVVIAMVGTIGILLLREYRRRTRVTPVME